jgi:hypothetical protein
VAELVDEFGEARERIVVRERGIDEAIRIIAICVGQILSGTRNRNAEGSGQKDGE